MIRRLDVPNTVTRAVASAVCRLVAENTFVRKRCIHRFDPRWIHDEATKVRGPGREERLDESNMAVADIGKIVAARGRVDPLVETSARALIESIDGAIMRVLNDLEFTASIREPGLLDHLGTLFGNESVTLLTNLEDYEFLKSTSGMRETRGRLQDKQLNSCRVGLLRNVKVVAAASARPDWYGPKPARGLLRGAVVKRTTVRFTSGMLEGPDRDQHPETFSHSAHADQLSITTIMGYEPRSTTQHFSNQALYRIEIDVRQGVRLL